MNFCKECDEYISLYIDGLLEEKIESEFIKHVEQCSECSAKFEAASYLAELCKGEEIPLPENFSASLHTRLQEVSGNINIKNNESKFMFVIKSKRFIASFSTAAVLVISLMAYNLLPNMGTIESTSKDSESAQIKTEQKIENKQAADSNNTANKNSSSKIDEATQYEASSNSTLSDTKSANASNSVVTTDDKDIKVTFNKSTHSEKTESKTDKNNVKERAYQGDKGKSESSTEKDTDKTKKALMFSTALDAPSDNASDTGKHISNYAEIKVDVSPNGTEIEDLKKLMSDVGAYQITAYANNNVAEKSDINSTDSTAKANSDASTYKTVNTTLPVPEYIDYCLTLSQFSKLESQTAKYNVEFSSKTDIIEKDVSQIYNDLNKQKIEIDNKISIALEKGENISAYEAERERLTKEMGKIITEKDIVIVRMFFVNK